MSISNFDFPKVTLRQVFVPQPAGAVNALGVACVGPVWHYNSPDSTELDITEWASDGRYFDAYLPDVTTEGASNFKAAISGGIWSYYTIEDSLDEDSGFEVTDSESRTLHFKGTDPLKWNDRRPKSGDYMLLLSGSVRQLRRIDSLAAATRAGSTKKEAFVSLVTLGGRDYLSDNTGTTELPASIDAVTLCTVADWQGDTSWGWGASEDLGKKLSFPVGAIESGAMSALFGDYIDLSDSLSTNDTIEAFAFVGLDKVNGGRIDVRYRSTNPLIGGKSYGTVSTLSDVNYVLGPASADNPVALGCYFAIAAGGGTVHYKGTAGNGALQYVDAIDYLDRYNEIYSIVPCWISGADGDDIVEQCFAKVYSASEDVESRSRKTLWYGVSCSDDLGNDTAAQVDFVLSKRRTNSYRAQCVWADGAKFNGESIDQCNYALAAAAAGMRAGQPVHRPLSNLGYSFFSVTEERGFTTSQLKELGRNGIWIIANNAEGSPINMRQVTTAAADSLNMDEESCVANADDIAMSVAGTGGNLVGCSNISPELLQALGDTIRTRMNAKLVSSYGPYIGPQLISWEMTKQPYQDPVNLDHVLAEFTITPPKPFNQFHMTLVVL